MELHKNIVWLVDIRVRTKYRLNVSNFTDRPTSISEVYLGGSSVVPGSYP